MDLTSIWGLLLTQAATYGIPGLLWVGSLMVIIHLDKERTKAGEERAKEWAKEREFYQNHYVSNLAQLSTLLAKHEERAQERHETSLQTTQKMLVLVERLLERTTPLGFNAATRTPTP